MNVTLNQVYGWVEAFYQSGASQGAKLGHVGEEKTGVPPKVAAVSLSCKATSPAADKQVLRATIERASQQLGVKFDLDAAEAKVGLKKAARTFRAEARKRVLLHSTSFNAYGLFDKTGVEQIETALSEKKIDLAGVRSLCANEHLERLCGGRFDEADALATQFRQFFAPVESDVRAAMRLWVLHDNSWVFPKESLAKVNCAFTRGALSSDEYNAALDSGYLKVLGFVSSAKTLNVYLERLAVFGGLVDPTTLDPTALRLARTKAFEGATDLVNMHTLEKLKARLPIIEHTKDAVTDKRYATRLAESVGYLLSVGKNEQYTFLLSEVEQRFLAKPEALATFRNALHEGLESQAKKLIEGIDVGRPPPFGPQKAEALSHLGYLTKAQVLQVVLHAAEYACYEPHVQEFRFSKPEYQDSRIYAEAKGVAMRLGLDFFGNFPGQRRAMLGGTDLAQKLRSAELGLGGYWAEHYIEQVIRFLPIRAESGDEVARRFEMLTSKLADFRERARTGCHFDEEVRFFAQQSEEDAQRFTTAVAVFLSEQLGLEVSDSLARD